MCGTEIYEYYTASILSTDEKVVRKKKKKNPDEKYLQNRSMNVLNSLREKKTCSKRG
jgi:hypothetical protein